MDIEKIVIDLKEIQKKLGMNIEKMEIEMGSQKDKKQKIEEIRITLKNIFA